jgi:hypothetical protein
VELLRLAQRESGDRRRDQRRPARLAQRDLQLRRERRHHVVGTLRGEEVERERPEVPHLRRPRDGVPGARRPDRRERAHHRGAAIGPLHHLLERRYERAIVAAELAVGGRAAEQVGGGARERRIGILEQREQHGRQRDPRCAQRLHRGAEAAQQVAAHDGARVAPLAAQDRRDLVARGPGAATS